MGKNTLFYYCCFFWHLYLNAQPASQIFQLHAFSNVSVEKLAVHDKQLVVGGLFRDTFDWEGLELASAGENDIFIGTRSNGALDWAQALGSTGQDELLALTTDQQGNILVSLSYLNEIAISGHTIIPNSGSRGLLLLKFSPSGELLWHKELSSTGAQAIYGICTDTNDYIYTCGYFGGELSIGEQVWEAQATTDSWVSRFSPSGELVWLQHAGLAGEIAAQSIALTNTENNLIVSGRYNGQVVFAQDTLLSNTDDWDVFVTKWDIDGDIQWGRKAGGILDDNNTAILSNTANEIFVVGDFQGVMRLDGDIQITSVGIQDNNLFLLKYDAQGTPLWARSLGGSQVEYATAAIWRDSDQIAVSGYFQETTSFDDFSASAAGTFNTFVADFSSVDGQILSLTPIQGEGIVLGNALVADGAALYVGGGFDQTIFAPNMTLESAGGFDGFVMVLDKSTAISSLEATTLPLYLFPNPTNDVLHIETNWTTFSIKITNLLGEVVWTSKNQRLLNTEPLGAGIYFIEIRHPNQGHAIGTFVKN